MEVNRDVIMRLLMGLRECSRYVERGVAEHPLDELDVGLLMLAEAAGGDLRPSQAAEALEAAFPTITRHVRGLRDDGRVTIDPDPGDGRSYRIVLTPAGQAMLDEFRDELTTRFALVLDGWDQAEVAALADGLAKLLGSMGTARRTLDPRQGRSAAWWRADTPAEGADTSAKGDS